MCWKGPEAATRESSGTQALGPRVVALQEPEIGRGGLARRVRLEGPAPLLRGALRLVFTFVLPLGVMTTFPPMALLGRLDLSSLSIALALAVGGLGLARLAWMRGIAAYRSASS